MAVFTDSTVNARHLTITTSADWSIVSGGLPNGDNAVDGDGSIAATYNTAGTAFNLMDGTAWTIELWVKRTADFALEMILSNADAGSTTEAWRIYMGGDNKLYCGIINTGGGAYLGELQPTLTLNAWHHIVVVKETGNVWKLYNNATLFSTDNTTSGTARTPSGTYRLYFGTRANGVWSMSTTYVSKLAIYNRELSYDEVNEHYLTMAAA